MRIRKIEILNFRCIKRFFWCPSDGLNCLIGPGDSGKSTVIDAIDYCLGARRTAQFTDADFHNLDVDTPISITLTLGDLDDALKNLDAYGLYLRSFDQETGRVEDEPEKDLETVLTLNLKVESDLEPVWSLLSDRATAQNASRNLAWKDRIRSAPSRIGALSSYNLGWRHGSVLNKLTDEKADSAAALAYAARQARRVFGEDAETQVEETLRIVSETSKELGVDIGDKAHAQLDAHSVNFSSGTISLHNENGVPLRGLGVGSTRLLIAGLQRKAFEKSSLLLVDEVEFGLEPHRIIRFLSSLGAKESETPFQVFMTTHSPVVFRELSGNQLYVLREREESHVVMPVGVKDGIQGTIRCFPESFLASSVMVCEGASEVGLIRGLDLYLQSKGEQSIFAAGVSLVDASGVSKIMARAMAFQSLGYRVVVFRDDDEQPNLNQEQSFERAGGTVVKWRQGEKLESEIFNSLSDLAIALLVDKAVDIHDYEFIDQHLKSASQNSVTLDMIPKSNESASISKEHRRILGIASSGKHNPWFKNVSAMEEIGRYIIGPHVQSSDKEFKTRLNALFIWARNA
ncbi:SMC domain protein [Desulfatibacillum aliphaticivorans]|uniref:SMC domain protein n=1 Tax=Desulfatibacillum aliphaticivorans TaxID=218208 RepID=B8FD16_DESAL|nr:ATP-binding protein [Desulfatibacillum aliphaticivorans]ACL06447.1 SMC domain protein [Desulfatibacillum aliphaticivorans]